MKFINYLLFMRMKQLIERSNKKIKRLEFNLKVEKAYNEKISKDTLELIKKLKN